MKKLLTVICSLAMTLTLCACSTSNNASTTVENKTLKDYFDQYKQLNCNPTEKGAVFVLDDGSKYGLAVLVTLTQDQMERIWKVSDYSETFEADLQAVAEESNTFKVVSLDEYVPDMTAYDKYVGQKLSVLYDDGYISTSVFLYDDATFFEITDEPYSIYVTVEELVSAGHEMTEEFERNLTIKSFRFSYWTFDFFDSLYE